MIRNPILPGFNPDPSICRVDDDYYIATSTFEWYPGIQLFHSRDLEHWRLLHRPLDRPALLDMTGVPDSCGIWAPCLTHCDGRFHLCYTVARRFDGNFKDTHNYLTTSETIAGPWSDPVYLGSGGFDPSLFHDQDGRKWYLNMVWDHRPDRSFFGGIALQEYDPERQQLLGERTIIFKGTALGRTEGPHLHRFGDHYYLVTAEGGTGYDHAVTVSRSRSIFGPYVSDPEGPLITSANAPDAPLQRTGHADLVETPDGRLYMCHLASRPLPGLRRSPMGRETCLQRVEFSQDGWIRLAGGGHVARLTIPSPGLEPCVIEPDPVVSDFDNPVLDPVFQWLRTPCPERWISLTRRPGHLRLSGRESLGSPHEQALVARRQVDFSFLAETCMEFEPRHFQQQAGLVLYYNGSRFHYLYVSRDDEAGKHLAIMSCEGDPGMNASFPGYDRRVPLPEDQPVWLRAEVTGPELRFSWSLDGEVWRDMPHALDASMLSDEAGRGEHASFTGCFVGLCCQDLAGTRLHADFDYFAYRATPP